MGKEDPLEKEMATHSNTTEEPSELQFIESDMTEWLTLEQQTIK